MPTQYNIWYSTNPLRKLCTNIFYIATIIDMATAESYEVLSDKFNTESVLLVL
jgi:hypothetical protein